MKQPRKVKSEEVKIEQPIPTGGTTINYVEEVVKGKYDLDPSHYGK